MQSQSVGPHPDVACCITESFNNIISSQVLLLFFKDKSKVIPLNFVTYVYLMQ